MLEGKHKLELKALASHKGPGRVKQVTGTPVMPMRAGWRTGSLVLMA